jgi:hypothetical protein
MDKGLANSLSAARPSLNAVRPPDPAVALTDEALVADARAGLTPAQMVEHKLASILKCQPLPVSHRITANRIGRSN